MAAATISATVFSGRLLAMMWTSGVSPVSAIGVKSVTGLYGAFFSTRFATLWVEAWNSTV